MIARFYIRLIGLLKQLTSRDLPAYFAQYELPSGYTSPSPLTSKAATPGLLAWIRAQPSTGNAQLYSYWISETSFQLSGSDFAARLGLPAPAVTGHVGALSTAPQSIWQLSNLWKLVIGVSAFLGAVNVILPYFYSLLAAPVITISLSKKHSDVVAGETFELPFEIRNGASYSARDIEMRGSVSRMTEFGAQPPISITAVESQIPELPPFDKGSNKLMGTPLEAGRYNVTIIVNASAGRLLGRHEFSRNVVVEAWPTTPTAELVGIALNETYGRLEGTVRIGPEAPKGVECELLLLNVQSNTTIVSLTHNSRALEFETHSDSSRRRRVISWNAPPSKQFEVARVQANLQGPANTSWSSVAKNSSLGCANRR